MLVCAYKIFPVFHSPFHHAPLKKKVLKYIVSMLVCLVYLSLFMLYIVAYLLYLYYYHMQSLPSVLSFSMLHKYWLYFTSISKLVDFT